MTRLIARCRGHHAPQEERLFHALTEALSADATMIELGSNWAYYCCWFLRGGRDRRAVLLEPDPQNRAVGERNLALNGLQASVVEGFAGAESAPRRDFVTEHSGMHSLPQYSVPQLMESQGIGTLDLLHCKIHGAELDVLTGCRSLFRSGRIRWVMVATHVHQLSNDYLTHQRCLALLREEGGAVQFEFGPYESFTGNGLIVASFGEPPSGWSVPPISRTRAGESLFRDPQFDLAEVGPLADRSSDHVRRMVVGAYQAILLRDPDQLGMDIFGKDLLETGDARKFLLGLLKSPEFSSSRDRFVAEYFPLPPQRTAG
jgi:FkbM family methyltransferase